MRGEAPRPTTPHKSRKAPKYESWCTRKRQAANGLDRGPDYGRDARAGNGGHGQRRRHRAGPDGARRRGRRRRDPPALAQSRAGDGSLRAGQQRRRRLCGGASSRAGGLAGAGAGDGQRPRPGRGRHEAALGGAGRDRAADGGRAGEGSRRPGRGRDLRHRDDPSARPRDGAGQSLDGGLDARAYRHAPARRRGRCGQRAVPGQRRMAGRRTWRARGKPAARRLDRHLPCPQGRSSSGIGACSRRRAGGCRHRPADDPLPGRRGADMVRAHAGRHGPAPAPAAGSRPASPGQAGRVPQVRPRSRPDRGRDGRAGRRGTVVRARGPAGRGRTGDACPAR